MRDRLLRKTVFWIMLGALGLSSCTHVEQAPSAADPKADDPAPIAPPALAEQRQAEDTSKLAASIFQPSSDVIGRIREEGMNHSQVMQTLSYLSDVIGPRLTGSPNLRRANEWTREKLASWGLKAHVEPWGQFGRGWTLKHYSAQIVEPQNIVLIGFPKAWSPGLHGPIEAPVVYIDVKEDKDLDQYRGKLKGAIVLVSPIREIQPRFEPMAMRVSEGDLLKLANADGARVSPYPGAARALTPSERRNLLPPSLARRGPATSPALQPAATAPAARNPAATRRANFARSVLPFLIKEGAAVVVDSSTQGDGGTLFVASATIPSTRSAGFNDPNAPRAYSLNAPATLPQITLAVESYNRLVRMIQQGAQLKMAVDLDVEFHDQDPMAYNTIAEIPGTDLKDQIVMIGAHMDSWHSGTGATDNGAGVAATMEAVRILKALDLHPRRTIRIGLWTGEEEGLLGSKAYVAEHVGKWSETSAPSGRRGRPDTRPSTRPARKLTTLPDYEKLSVYFNLDNGSGKIRGVYMEGNEGVRPIFRKWLAPFADLDAETLSAGKVVGTDHQSFDAIGIPAFQFIQDPLEYWTRTHHSNEDVYDHAVADDLKQAATIMATFLYDAAMTNDKLPRKAQ